MNILELIMDNGIPIAVALWIIGEIIKRATLIDNRFIPLLLLAFSVVITPAVLGGFTADNIIQAILITGLAVLSDQFIKQYLPGIGDE